MQAHRQKDSRHFPRPGAFTLVELLVVMVVVATVALIGITAATRVKEGARMMACASNMRNIGAAMQMYAGENGGVYPDTTHTEEQHKAWIYQLEEYLGNFDEMRLCPADPNRDLRLANKASSYILNSLVFVPPLDAFGEPSGDAFNRPARLPQPSRTILLFIASDRAGLYPGDDHTHSDQWRSWGQVIRDIAPDRHKRRDSTNSTKGMSNYLFADGHVESISADEIKSRIDKGDNIAAIPGIVR